MGSETHNNTQPKLCPVLSSVQQKQNRTEQTVVMPEETNTQEAKPKFTPEVLGSASRNGVTATVQTAEFKRQSKDKAGACYVGIDTTTLVAAPQELTEEQQEIVKRLQALSQFIGFEESFKFLEARALQKCQGIWREVAINNTGKPDKEVEDNELEWDNEQCLPPFVNALQEWSAISETIPELRKQLVELTSEIGEILLSGRADAMQAATALAKRIQKIEMDIKAKRRETKEEREARKAAEKQNKEVAA